MYRGRFALEAADLDDVIKNSEISDNDDDDAGGDDDSVVSTMGNRKLALCSPLNAGKKRVRLILGGGSDGTMTKKRLLVLNEELEALIRGDYMGDFILLVQGYPHRRCNNVPRPLTTTLFMDRCVFGRHVETERIVAFLLQSAPTTCSQNALAVVGAKKVGKATLLRHVCNDERVREHFAHIQWFHCEDEFDAGKQLGQTERSLCLAGMRSILDEEPRFSSGRSLLVFKDAWPVEESAWTTLLAASSKLAEGSKVLFTCRDVNFARTLRTTEEPVVLRPLPEEAFWYYFKAFALGGADPRDHPRITAVGRDISRHLTKSTFLDARLLGTVLRANLDAPFWRRVLAAILRCQRRPRYSLYADVLAIRGWRLMPGRWVCPPRFSQLTLQDVFRAATSSSASGLGGSDTEEFLTINYCRDTLYKDIWYTITYELLHDDNNRIN
ncbi:hypothetical protein QOZ80_4BG0333660 [Eleusine coracana subsp. coracana]|nr:hypothetical protein QOZ80_4BG0333660 [Eleusine coracana subsp. coracana]